MMKSFSLSTVLVATVVACSSYGSSGDESSSSSGGPVDSGGGGDGAAKSDGGVNGNDGAVSDGGGDSGESFTEQCPVCPSGVDACLPSGCSGAGANNACNKPYDVSMAMTVLVFACPEGPTTPLPAQAACGGGGPKHGALFRLGNATTNWTVDATGLSPFVVFGDCTSNTGGGCDSMHETKDVAPFLNVFVGTSSAITSCAQIKVTFTPH